MSVLLLIKIIIILIICIIATLILFCKDISQFISEKRRTFNKLIIKNEGFFTIFFVLAFLIEQLLFIIILAYFFKASKWLSAIVGIFALIVVTTATFQKFVWEYKFKWAAELSKRAQYAYHVISEQREFIDSLISKLRKKQIKSEK